MRASCTLVLLILTAGAHASAAPDHPDAPFTPGQWAMRWLEIDDDGVPYASTFEDCAGDGEFLIHTIMTLGYGRCRLDTEEAQPGYERFAFACMLDGELRKGYAEVQIREYLVTAQLWIGPSPSGDGREFAVPRHFEARFLGTCQPSSELNTGAESVRRGLLPTGTAPP